MTIAQRKLLLQMECACDRVEIAIAIKRATEPPSAAAALTGSVGQVALDTAAALFPRKLRWISLVVRLWRRFKAR